jgi:hypothetical protein
MVSKGLTGVGLAVVPGPIAPAGASAGNPVIACDKREAFAQGSEATKQTIYPRVERWIASLRSQ